MIESGIRTTISKASVNLRLSPGREAGAHSDSNVIFFPEVILILFHNRLSGEAGLMQIFVAPLRLQRCYRSRQRTLAGATVYETVSRESRL
jgi:hypothetical protein